MSKERDKIIQRAIEIKLDDTCLGFYFFSADDILTVAGIDEARIQEIAAELSQQPPED